MRYIRFTKHFVEKPMEECGPNELPADPTLRDKVRTTEWSNALFWVLYEAYAKIRGQPYWSPDCVMDETKEFIGQEQELRSRLAERYVFGSDVSNEDYVPFKDIKDYLNNECGFNGSWSDARFGRELNILGLRSENKRINGKVVLCRLGIRLAE